jgi:hypothetical protein
MFGRWRASQRDDDADKLGVGMQVVIKPDESQGDDDWAGEPSGVIVSRDDNIMFGTSGTSGSRSVVWVVVFDAPQFLKSGRGPFHESRVAGWRLEQAIRS